MTTEGASARAVRRAEELFARGLPCSQCVLLSLQDDFDIPESLVVASEGLVEGTTQVCSAFVSALLALGYLAGREGAGPEHPPTDEWLDVVTPSRNRAIRDRVQALKHWFENEALERYGGLECRVISGADWESAPATRMLIHRPEHCREVLRETVAKLYELLQVKG